MFPLECGSFHWSVDLSTGVWISPWEDGSSNGVQIFPMECGSFQWSVDLSNGGRYLELYIYTRCWKTHKVAYNVDLIQNQATLLQPLLFVELAKLVFHPVNLLFEGCACRKLWLPAASRAQCYV
jgi:hypothetical protein